MSSEVDSAPTVVMTKRWQRVVFSLTLLIAVVEGGFMLLVSTAQQWLATPVAGPLNLGLLLGVLATLSGCCVAWLYVSWANRSARAGVTT